MENVNAIGKVLRIVRCANNLTVKKASIASGVSAAYISDLELQKKNNVSDKILEKFAKAYHLTLPQLKQLEAYCKCLDEITVMDEETRFRWVLMRTLEMIEHNHCKEKYSSY